MEDWLKFTIAGKRRLSTNKPPRRGEQKKGNRTMQAKRARRTAMKIVPLHDEHNKWIPTEKITCEVTGEMSNGAKVWTDVETGEQYFLTRMLGEYMFYHI